MRRVVLAVLLIATVVAADVVGNRSRFTHRFGAEFGKLVRQIEAGVTIVFDRVERR